MPGLVSNLASNLRKDFEEQISGKELREQEMDLHCSFRYE